MDEFYFNLGRWHAFVVNWIRQQLEHYQVPLSHHGIWVFKNHKLIVFWRYLFLNLSNYFFEFEHFSFNVTYTIKGLMYMNLLKQSKSNLNIVFLKTSCVHRLIILCECIFVLFSATKIRHLSNKMEWRLAHWYSTSPGSSNACAQVVR